MSETDYRTTVDLNADARMVYGAVATCDGISGWWTRFTSFDGREGSEALMRFPSAGFHARMRVDELKPPERVVWTCVDAKHPSGVSSDPNDWIGTRISFDIQPEDNGRSRLTFTHHGLRPLECAEVCTDVWRFYLHESLKKFVEDGRGEPATE
jgi:uncharacterized protein YndB with AHSA1/START domain